MWAGVLSGDDIVILDCLRPALDALGLSENTEAGQFLTAFGELLGEACVPEAIAIHHTGHAGERSRWDSRILDPDAIWSLRRDGEDAGANVASAPRYFSAYGRDVEQPERRLDFAARGQRLTLSGATRKQDRAAPALNWLLEDALDSTAELSRRAVLEKAKGVHTRTDVLAALDLGVARGLVILHLAPRTVLCTVVVTVRRSAPAVRQSSECQCAIRVAHGAHRSARSQCAEQSHHGGRL
ncbi:hypothetical protein AESSP_01913 [Aestuariimicrobium sp. T2.26MG-19.2B]|nr:hypothetical protein AESSP_01913 [Aestuariimicrobium sp. T2.26MG-19.2B]